MFDVNGHQAIRALRICLDRSGDRREKRFACIQARQGIERLRIGRAQIRPIDDTAQENVARARARPVYVAHLCLYPTPDALVVDPALAGVVKNQRAIRTRGGLAAQGLIAKHARFKMRKRNLHLLVEVDDAAFTVYHVGKSFDFTEHRLHEHTTFIREDRTGKHRRQFLAVREK